MKGGSSSTNKSRRWEVEGLLLPGLDNGTALRCLAFVPLYMHPLLASLNRAYHSLILSATLLDLRRTLGLADHLLVFKSLTSFHEVPNLRVFDLKCNTWMTLKIPSDIKFHKAAPFFCSGKRLLSLQPSSSQYDFAANKWSQAPLMLECIPRDCAFASNPHYCFIAGGVKGWDNLESTGMFDPVKNSWHPLPPLPSGRHFCRGFFMDDKFYVIGGTDGLGDVCLADAEVYDPSSKAWSSIQSMFPVPSSEQLMAVVKNELYAVHLSQSIASNPALHVYQKLTNTWQCLGPVLDKHDEGNLYIWDGGLVSIGSNKLLVVGEWWPKSEVDDKRTYILCWEPSLKATLCRFVIVYSGPAGTCIASYLPINDSIEVPPVEGQFRLGREPACYAVVT